jgi:hypothetical protein
MASVTLEFIPPDEPDLALLHVYESTAADSTFAEIDSAAAGTYPNYITRYTTTLASSADDWFAIAWENTAGTIGGMSQPLQGGSTTVVSEIVNRVLLRDPSLNPIIVGQEAEVAVCEYYGVNDPYSISMDQVTPQVLSGLTYYTMARCYIVTATTQITTTATSAGKWTAGIVSMDAGGSSSSTKTSGIWDAIDRLLKAANLELGWNQDRILLMKQISAGGYAVGCGNTYLKGVDLTRSTVEIYALP